MTTQPGPLPPFSAHLEPETQNTCVCATATKDSATRSARPNQMEPTERRSYSPMFSGPSPSDTRSYSRRFFIESARPSHRGYAMARTILPFVRQVGSFLSPRTARHPPHSLRMPFRRRVERQRLGLPILMWHTTRCRSAGSMSNSELLLAVWSWLSSGEPANPPHQEMTRVL